MRIYLYLLAGITSALIGWNIAQFIFLDLGFLQNQQLEEIILFPCVAISLAVGMVMNEIFISNPTRLSLCWRKAWIPILIAIGLGSLLGISAGGIAQLLYIPGVNIPPAIVRTITWLLVGICVGLSEGLTWRWQTVEAGDSKRFWRRFYISLIGGIVASLVAAFISESIRILPETPLWVRKAEAPIGFSLLGLLLGLNFSITNSPSYQAALRAGTGFEYLGEIYDDIPQDSKPLPSIQKPLLTFVSDSLTDEIEEGLSIQLPSKGVIVIGSETNDRAHIYLPGIPSQAGEIHLQHRHNRFRIDPA